MDRETKTESNYLQKNILLEYNFRTQHYLEHNLHQQFQWKYFTKKRKGESKKADLLPSNRNLI